VAGTVREGVRDGWTSSGSAREVGALNFGSVTGKGIGRDIGTAFFGRAGASVLRLGVVVLLARVLKPEEYGLAAVLLNSGLLLSTTLEFGLGAAYIQQESLTPDVRRQERHFLSLLLGRFRLWIGLLGGTAALSLAGANLTLMTLAVLLYGTGQNLCNSFLTLSQVRQDFREYARVSLLMALLQLAWVAVLAGAYLVSPFRLTLLLFLLGVAGWAPLPLLATRIRRTVDKASYSSWKEDLRYLASLLPFAKWVGLSSIAVQAFSRYGVLLLGSQAALAEAARYDVAMSVGRSINLLAQSTAAALFPRFAQRPGAQQARRWLADVLRTGGFTLAVGLALYYLPGRWLVPLLFGASYRASVTYLDILMPGLLLPLFVEVVVGIVTFTLRSPASVFWIRTAKLAIFLLSGNWLLAHYSVRGLAFAQTALSLLETAAILGFAFWAARPRQR